ncbi:hypothetical protein GH714_019764 [Hevea brasiliensis]|uniref:Homeobox domain-containing protein n=1 Tax=Hevea brasiliensis TaxID=3981 RepID=A0A6A6MBN3_HEVBR|nr:hypothetical protein GH714_019764 [Hevea brasiliensis]
MVKVTLLEWPKTSNQAVVGEAEKRNMKADLGVIIWMELQVMIKTQLTILQGRRDITDTPQQIQELEALFKECPHPDEKQRLELSKRLCLETRQVKFWFQNRRTQMKTQLERHENSLLRQENDKLRAENMSLRDAMRNPICSNCGGPAIIGDISLEEQHLRIENARLKDELDRVCALAGKFLGRPFLHWLVLLALRCQIQAWSLVLVPMVLVV